MHSPEVWAFLLPDPKSFPNNETYGSYADALISLVISNRLEFFLFDKHILKRQQKM